MSDTYKTTIEGLETGLQVRHIATFDEDLYTCQIDDERDLATIFAEPQGYDHIPVRQGKSIIGVVVRGSTGKVADNFHRLSELNIISAQEPLTNLLPLMLETSYRLVLQSGFIKGIVTRSDLLKLPIRIYVFSLVTHLEILMSDIIRARYPDSQEDTKWLEFLKPERQTRVREKQQKLAQGNRELPLLECTDFCDKRDIVRKICSLPEKFKRELDSIERDLRNTVAHAGDYAQDDEQTRRFIELVQVANTHIKTLQDKLSEFKKAQAKM